MPNNLTNLNAEWWESTIQLFLNNMLVAMQICNTKQEALLQSGQQVNFPYVNDLTVSNYAQGTDITPQTLTATNSLLTVNQSKVVSFIVDPVQQKQATSTYVATMAAQSAFRLSNEIDKQVLSDCATLAFTTGSQGTVNTSTIFNVFTSARAALFYQNALDKETWAVIDATRLSYLTQTFVANGFVQADKKLEDGFSPFAGMCDSFRVYVSNNLPSFVSLDLSTQPTAGQTFTIAGATWTFVANGTATVPGDISIGGSAAATQAIVVDAINGTGTPGASTYIDVANDPFRINYSNNSVNAGAFVANVALITGVGPINPSSTLVNGTDGFNTAQTYMLFGSMGAPSLAIQMQPTLYIHPLQYQLGLNYMTHTLYGSTLFFRDRKRVVAYTINA